MEAKRFAVRVTAPPVEDGANQVLTRLLAKELGVPRSDVWAVGGLGATEVQCLLGSESGGWRAATR